MTNIPNQSSDLPNNSPNSKNKPSISILPAKPSDSQWIEQSHARVFGPGRFARAAFRVRENIPIDPSLSLIAKIDGQKVASVIMTPISLCGVNGYLLGPLATEIKSRGMGVGGLLVKQACANVMKTGQAKFVLLVGDLSYYGAHGFERATLNAISFPAPLDQSRILIHCDDKSLLKSLNGLIKPWIKT